MWHDLLDGKEAMNVFNQLQKGIPYRFNQVKLLQMALTHTSAVNETDLLLEHNERLEFLGDAVLELCISSELYSLFPDAREGELTALRSQLVNQQSLADLAKKLGIETCLILGKGEEAQGGRNKETLLGDALEALLGAIYLDGGFLAVSRVVRHLFSDRWADLSSCKRQKDHKSLLQEETQRLFKERPIYMIKDSSGPEHDRVFTVCLDLPGGHSFEGNGSSVKRAEQHAAEQALTYLGDAKQ